MDQLTKPLYELIWSGSLSVKDYDTFAGCYTDIIEKLNRCFHIEIINKEISEAEIYCAFELKFFDTNVLMNIKQFSFNIRCNILQNSLPSYKNFNSKKFLNHLKGLPAQRDDYLVMTSPGLSACYTLFKFLEEVTDENSNMKTTHLLEVDILRI